VNEAPPPGAVRTRLDERGREAYLGALGDRLARGLDGNDPGAALTALGAAGPGALALGRAIDGALRGGRHLSAALVEAGCLTPAEGETLRAFASLRLQGAGLRLLVDRRVARRARLRAMGAAALTPVALTFVTLLTLQAPLMLLGAVTASAAARPAILLAIIGAALLLLGRALLRRAGPAWWTRGAAWPLLGAHLARRAEIELATALALLARDDRATTEAYEVAAVFVAPPTLAAALRRRTAPVPDGDPGPPDEPWHPALRLAILGGAAAGCLRQRCAAWAEAGETALTARWVLWTRVVAYVGLFAVSSWALSSLVNTEIKLPGLEGMPALDGLDLTDPAGALEKVLMKELQ
jgi:hypothetical protein